MDYIITPETTPQQDRQTLLNMIRDLGLKHDDDKAFREVASDAFNTLFEYMGCKLQTKIVFKEAL